MTYEPKYKTFKFKSWKVEGSKVTFFWQFDDDLEFEEQLIWPDDTQLNESEEFKQAANLYLILAGTSYYKTYPTKEFKIEAFEIDDFQAEFFNRTYMQGLGEYLYRNQLSPEVICQFEQTRQPAPSPKASDQEPSGSLLMIGGGKDSLVSADLLTKAGKEFTSFRVNSLPWIDAQMAKIGQPTSIIKRVLDPKLTNGELQDALNGHVPVTSIISTAALLEAINKNIKNIICSNEASASIANTNYEGLDINHQYSKSFEFEHAYSAYIKNYISPQIEYFSLPRPWSELKIAKYFADNVLDEFTGQWSSSNYNFRLDYMADKPSWNADYSPKTLAVFALFAPFVEREKLIKEFGNQNLFEGATDNKVLQELIGNEGIKPFECVADIEEMRWALITAKQSGNWPELSDLEVPETPINPMNNLMHQIPDEFVSLVS